MLHTCALCSVGRVSEGFQAAAGVLQQDPLACLHMLTDLLDSREARSIHPSNR